VYDGTPGGISPAGRFYVPAVAPATQRHTTATLRFLDDTMAYDEALADRIRTALADDPLLTEKRMFGGLAFLHRGLMFVGVSGSKLMARVGKDHYRDSLARTHVREMDFTGKPMQGYVYVEPPGLRSEEQLRFWLQRCKEFVSSLPAKAAKGNGRRK
jgi:hypothetical protein